MPNRERNVGVRAIGDELNDVIEVVPELMCPRGRLLLRAAERASELADKAWRTAV